MTRSGTRQTGSSGLWILLVVLAGGPATSIAAAQTDPSAPSRHAGALDYVGIYTLRPETTDGVGVIGRFSTNDESTEPENGGPMILDGRGVTIAAVCRSATYLAGRPQGDYRPDTSHPALAGASIIFADPLARHATISEHATAVAAILVGRDPVAVDPAGNVALYEGAVPAATLQVHEFWRFVRDHVLADAPVDADVVTLSLGMTFEDWWTRGLQHLVERDAVVVVAPAGNGSAVRDPLLYPAAGPNVIAVGMVPALVDENGLRLDGFDLVRPAHSSIGPAPDGRSKPDLVAPSNGLIPDPDGSGYRYAGDWSSYAVPVVSGTAALLIQQIREDPRLVDVLGRDGFNCLMRAVLMNSARKLPFWHKGRPDPDDDHVAPLDWLQGAGMVDAVGAIEQLRAGPAEHGSVAPAGWDLNVIERSGVLENVYTIDPPPTAAALEVTLVWNRHFEPRYPFAARPSDDTDLRLEVWAVDPENPQATRRLDYSDSPIDNVEHIHCILDPDVAQVEIVVRSNRPDPAARPDGLETYALAWRTVDRSWPEHPAWADLNDDGRIEPADHLIADLLDMDPAGAGELLTTTGLAGLLDLSPERLDLLRAYWPAWAGPVATALNREARAAAR